MGIEKKYKVAFIGAGYMTIEHIKAFKSLNNVKLSGIYSRTFSRAENLAKQFDINQVCKSVEELYESTKADLVVISVPELSTKEVVFKSFDYPWYLLIEKPVGYNYEQANEIKEYAEKKNAKAYVALNRRFYSSTIEAINLLKSENDKRIIHIQDQEDPKLALKAGQPKLVTENWMYANSIHIIDYFRLFGRGSIINIENIEKYDKNNPFYVHSKILFSSGDVGIYQAFWDAPAPWSVTVTSRQKKIELKPVEKLSTQKYGSRNIEQIKLDSDDIDFKPGLKKQAEAIINLIQGNKIHYHLSDLNESLKTMEIIKKIYNN
tara:strand:+ start:5064 stop:6023 length:960 start_codon:yes stop_codon:yes gene_type:complete